MPFTGYTGHLYEEEVLGTCLVSWDGRTYVKYREAMDMVRRSQPWDPRQPRCETARRFRDAICEEMHIADPASMRFYTAIGSPLDRFHSIDAFFEFNGLVVTIDVTLNEQKGSYRANVIVSKQDVDSGFYVAAMKVADAFKWAERGRRDAVRV